MSRGTYAMIKGKIFDKENILRIYKIIKVPSLNRVKHHRLLRSTQVFHQQS